MEINLDRDRVAELHLRLIDEQDRGRRASMHLELATLALRDGKLEHATRHFREALLLDDKLERARTGLRDLAERSKLNAPGRRGLVRSLLDRFKRRAAS